MLTANSPILNLDILLSIIDLALLLNTSNHINKLMVCLVEYEGKLKIKGNEKIFSIKDMLNEYVLFSTFSFFCCTRQLQSNFHMKIFTCLLSTHSTMQTLGQIKDAQETLAIHTGTGINCDFYIYI